MLRTDSPCDGCGPAAAPRGGWTLRRPAAHGLAALAAVLLAAPSCAALPMQRVCVAPDGRGFVLAPSRQPFTPWGHNYASCNIEESWDKDWSIIARDFAEMKKLGATVARVHLQFPRFMDGPDKPNARSLKQLARLLGIAEKTGVYLDITGLACYNPKERAAWYDNLSDQDRWTVQARFWEAVAATCASSPAVFCYDLMNEPVAGARNEGGWYGGRLGGYDFLQWLFLARKDLPREELARQWCHTLATAIRKHDPHHLITVGLLPPLNGKYFFGFVPEKIAPELDFIAVHIYPKAGKVDEALRDLKLFLVPGKPLIVEETFPLSCGTAELRQFLLESRGTACGWIGHYLKETPEELVALRQAGKITIAQAILLSWLDLFRDLGPQMLGRDAPGKP